MSWKTELTKLRRFLRDPDATIWTDAFVRHLYNDVQNDLQQRTGVLEDIEAQRIPGVYQWSYMHEREYRYLPETESSFYRALTLHDDLTICHRWEAQQRAGITATQADYGVHWTQPWEAFMGQTPGELVRMKFPRNFNKMKFIAYDEDPIDAVRYRHVSGDPSHITREGDPLYYFPVDEASNEYVLYPKPSVSFVHELEGEGMALYADDDTEDTTTGTIATRTGSTDSQELGAALDIVDTVDSIFMVYDVKPTDIYDSQDESDYPDFLRKYVRYGTISKAYGANTDGRIRSLADYWEMRYNLGIQAIKRFRSNRKQDRDYLLSPGVTKRRRIHPRLPDTYPHVGP
jgi:hypothetical protein